MQSWRALASIISKICKDTLWANVERKNFILTERDLLQIFNKQFSGEGRKDYLEKLITQIS